MARPIPREPPVTSAARPSKRPIGEPERDQWMRCMSQALDERIADDAAREALRAALAQLADHMRNRP